MSVSFHFNLQKNIKIEYLFKDEESDERYDEKTLEEFIEFILIHNDTAIQLFKEFILEYQEFILYDIHYTLDITKEESLEIIEALDEYLEPKG